MRNEIKFRAHELWKLSIARDFRELVVRSRKNCRPSTAFSHPRTYGIRNTHPVRKANCSARTIFRRRDDTFEPRLNSVTRIGYLGHNE